VEDIKLLAKNNEQIKSDDILEFIKTLTALTLLIAESNPKDKEKMIGIVLLLLKK
jgi:hypothetical protein